METLNNLIKDIPGEFWVGLSTFVIGYLAHIRSKNEAQSKAQGEKEERRLHAYELELEHLANKQNSIQDQMNASIERLQKERDILNARIVKLEEQIDELERQNFEWQVKYIQLLQEKNK